MKRFFLIIALSFFARLNCFAQVNLPFPDSSASWYETEIIYGGPGDPWTYSIGRFVVDGDTSIYGINYNKLYWYDNCDSLPDGIVGYYRVDSMKVYYRDEFSLPVPPLVNLPYTDFAFSDTGEVLIYDFDLQVGDTFRFQTNVIDSVSMIDSVLLNGYYYKRIEFQNMYTNGNIDPYYWIEGVGSTYGFFPAYFIFENALFFNCLASGIDTLSFNGPCTCSPLTINEYQNEEFEISIEPNPFANTTIISFPIERTHTFRIFDMLGKEVKQVTFTGKEMQLDVPELKKGMYFIKTEGIRTITGKIIVQ